jgi:hypothetical protein
MEADWEIEIGRDAPVLDAAWQGFVDLRMQIESATQLPEVAEFPPLGDALRQLNADSSPVWTAKSDFWPLTSIDPYEYDAPADDCESGYACYLDLFASDAHAWPSVDQVASWCKSQCTHLRQILLRSCRVDFIVRTAVLPQGQTGLGVTVYVSAAGRDTEGARLHLAQALSACADTVCRTGGSDTGSTLQWRQAGE